MPALSRLTLALAAFFVALVAVWGGLGGSAPATAACALSFETPKQLPDAAIGVRYRETISASGGSGRYFWQLTEGRLPPGIAITLGFGDGQTVVSGKPTTWGKYNFTIVLYDAPVGQPLICATPKAFNIDVPAADVRVSQEGPAAAVKVGDRIVIDIRVANDGPDATEKVSVSDVLPSGAKLQFGDVVEGAKGSCKLRPRGITLVCSLDRIKPGGGATIQLIMKATDPGAQENRVSATGRTFDQLEGNNTSTLEFTIERPKADVSVAMTGPAEVKVGEVARFKAAVSNKGPDSALGVMLWFPITGAEVTEIRVNGLKCKAEAIGGFQACEVGMLGSGKSETVVVVVTARQPGSIALQAKARTESDDADSKNNRASIDVKAVK